MWNKKGFSLLELLIVLAMIGLLTIIGMTQYQNIVQKARRSDALASLLDYHTRVQQCFILTHNYSECIETLTLDHIQFSSKKFYTISAQEYSEKHYLLEAKTYGQQKADVFCARFTIDQHQKKLAYYENGNKNNACW